jgi:hypothetical protein
MVSPNPAVLTTLFHSALISFISSTSQALATPIFQARATFYTMGFLEKITQPGYALIPSDRSATSSNDLLYDDVSEARPKSRISWRMKGILAVAGFMALAAYSVLIVTVTSTYWKNEALHGANVIDSEPSSHTEMSVTQS